METQAAHTLQKYAMKCVDQCLQVGVGDFVSVCPENDSEAVYIARVVSLWEDSSSMQHRKQFHARWFSRSCDTVLGEVGPLSLSLFSSLSTNSILVKVQKIT